MLEIKELSKIFGDKKVINNLSLQVKAGEIAFLLGPSGVGKSTLLRLLNGLEKSDQGTLLLDGKPLTEKDVGMVFQQFHLFDNYTVEQNILLPLIRVEKIPAVRAHQIANTLLARYGLKDKAHEPISTLSGGQKQRLALARSIAMKPRILCLDEPTSALDPLLTNSIASAIKDLAHEGFIILVASHDTTLLEQLPCTIYLMNSAGTIVQTASSDEFNQKPDQYKLIKQFVLGTE